MVLSCCALAMLSACSGNHHDEATGTDELRVSDVWARSTQAPQTAGAAYMTTESSVDDTLVSAAVNPDVAADAQIQETLAVEPTTSNSELLSPSMDPSATDRTSGESAMAEMSAMTMHEMDAGLPIPAGSVVKLKPGSYHVMLVDLVEPLNDGRRFSLTLQFARAGEVTVDVAVSETAPSDG